MGYYSYFRTKELFISVPEQDEETVKVIDTARKLAESVGGAFIVTSNANKAGAIVSDWLHANKNGIGYFFDIEDAEDDADVLTVFYTGESGKAYDFNRDLREFTDFLASNDLVLNGTIYRVGEDAGDVERFIVKDNKIVTNDSASLRFPDGSTFE